MKCLEAMDKMDHAYDKVQAFYWQKWIALDKAHDQRRLSEDEYSKAVERVEAEREKRFRRIRRVSPVLDFLRGI